MSRVPLSKSLQHAGLCVRKGPHPVHRPLRLCTVLMSFPCPIFSNHFCTPLFCLSWLELAWCQFCSTHHDDMQGFSSRPNVPSGTQAVSHVPTYLGFPLSNSPFPQGSGQGKEHLLRKKPLASCLFSLQSLSSTSPALVYAHRLVEPFTNFLCNVFFYFINSRLVFLQVFCFLKHPGLRNEETCS